MIRNKNIIKYNSPIKWWFKLKIIINSRNKIKNTKNLYAKKNFNKKKFNKIKKKNKIKNKKIYKHIYKIIK